jgi:hypothetical protein
MLETRKFVIQEITYFVAPLRDSMYAIVRSFSIDCPFWFRNNFTKVRWGCGRSHGYQDQVWLARTLRDRTARNRLVENRRENPSSGEWDKSEVARILHEPRWNARRKPSNIRMRCTGSTLCGTKWPRGRGRSGQARRKSTQFVQFPAVTKCADCGAAICSDCCVECCGGRSLKTHYKACALSKRVNWVFPTGERSDHAAVR